MGNQKLKGKDLRKIGYKSNQVKSLAINIMAQYYKHITKKQQLDLLSQLKATPEDFEEEEFLKPLVNCFIEQVAQQTFKAYELSDKPKPYAVYGKQFITANAIQQMDTAMQIPVALKGAMMPDAHLGYGLPVGGVLATKNEVIPYAVGMDIGCRMALSILNLPVAALQKNGHQFKVALKEEAHFGLGKTRAQLATHEVLERKEFKESELLRLVHEKLVRRSVLAVQAIILLSLG